MEPSDLRVSGVLFIHMQDFLESILVEQACVINVKILEAISQVELGSPCESSFQQVDGLFGLEVALQALEENLTGIPGEVVILADTRVEEASLSTS